MIYRLLLDPIPTSECARHLAQVRQDRAREAKRAFHRDMRARMGLEPDEALL